jgi:hypothetical protein
MNKKILISLSVVISLLIPISYSYSDSNIAGWWKVNINVQQGDFVTSEWIRMRHIGKRVTYLCIYLPSSNSGKAYFAFWDDLDQAYFLESYDLYVRNNIAILVVPTSFDADGNMLSGSNIVFRVYGAPDHIHTLKGYYALFDIESTGTPEQFVRMGSLNATRISPSKVPDEVANLIPGP